MRSCGSTKPRFFLMVVVLLKSFASIQVQETTTTAEKPKICLLDEDGLAFVPNVYYCNATQRCCAVRKIEPNCCNSDVSTKSIIEQVELWASLAGLFGFLGIAASCYFKDRYCCDGDPDDDEQRCLCFKRKRHPDSFATGNFSALTKILMPDKAAENYVADPIFGHLGSPEDVSKVATLHNVSLNLSTQQELANHYAKHSLQPQQATSVV